MCPGTAEPCGREIQPGGREAADCDLGLPLTPQSFFLVIHPLPPFTGCFHSILLFPLLSPVPDCGGGGGTRRGFRWLAVFRGFSEPQTLPRPPEF